eukprot:11342670-Heterocapsa_arctica.AAC.1
MECRPSAARPPSASCATDHRAALGRRGHWPEGHVCFGYLVGHTPHTQLSGAHQTSMCAHPHSAD